MSDNWAQVLEGIPKVDSRENISFVADKRDTLAWFVFKFVFNFELLGHTLSLVETLAHDTADTDKSRIYRQQYT